METGNTRATIAKNISMVMKLKGIQQKELAIALGVGPSAVSNWLGGTNSIDIDRLVKACEFLGVSLDQVIGLCKSPSPVYDLTEDEISIMLLYRGADEMSRQIATEILTAHQLKKERAAEEA